MGFLNTIGGFFFFLMFALFVERGVFIDLNLWWLILIETALSLFHAYITVQAVARAERSTFSFVRTATIPLVLLIDIALGYKLSTPALIGSVSLLSHFSPSLKAMELIAEGWAG